MHTPTQTLHTYVIKDRHSSMKKENKNTNIERNRKEVNRSLHTVSSLCIHF